MSENDTLVRLTGLWRNTTKAGETYLVGKLSPTSKLLILPNSRKEKESDPDYIAFAAPQKDKEDSQSQPQAQKKSWI